MRSLLLLGILVFLDTYRLVSSFSLNDRRFSGKRSALDTMFMVERSGNAVYDNVKDLCGVDGLVRDEDEVMYVKYDGFSGSSEGSRLPITDNDDKYGLGMNKADLAEDCMKQAVTNALDPPAHQDPVIASTMRFLFRACLIGLLTGGMIVVYKLSIANLAGFFFDDLAGVLPNPAFYWPLALYPILGSMVVCTLAYFVGPDICDGIESIAASVEKDEYRRYKPLKQMGRLVASIFTLASGISLGPEGPSVEIGTGISRLVADTGKYLPYNIGSNVTSSTLYKNADVNIDVNDSKGSSCASCSPLEQRQLFLAGTSAAVSAGFNAPITGIFFALECGNRYLMKNTMSVLQTPEEDGRPRADIAAIVLSATLSDIVVDFGLQHTESFSLQGNYYAMLSPLFELPLYVGLGLFCGVISVFFLQLKEFYGEIFKGNTWGSYLPVANLPSSIKPLVGGTICGIVAIFYPQTIFAGYTVLDGIISGKTSLGLPLLLQLLLIKIQLSALSAGSGLIGGIFAPALFFGATAGSAYHAIISNSLSNFHSLIDPYLSAEWFQYSNRFLTLANAPAYATVGAAATLGAIFRAPLTSSMLLFELTQNHDIVLPVLAATGLAGLFAEIISSSSIPTLDSPKAGV